MSRDVFKNYFRGYVNYVDKSRSLKFRNLVMKKLRVYITEFLHFLVFTKTHHQVKQ